ncbi:hypothetical protein [Anoxynatronum sibiricum]|uniref:Glycosyltransferase n=1 Tax=Anoxynatronum sibiricum TaxID=210623 RepID=A0ABU9VUD6_9CLOT
MTDKLNILILHRMGDPRIWRSAVRDIEYSLPDYAPEHHYIVHNAALPLPEFVKEIDFHAIVLGPTFLCNRHHYALLDKTLKEYQFIKYSKAFKIAMPQDDYDGSAILEKWLIEWDVDLIYTVCPEHWDVLYPNLANKNKLRMGYTAYISGAMIERCTTPKPFELRKIDVSYRSKQSYLGSTRYIKGIIGNVFRSNIQKYDLVLDISTNPKDTIHGDQWLDFVEDSKFVLGSNSGSSLLDPKGVIRFKVNHYLSSHPGASFEDVKDHCFQREEGKWTFTAISPRNIEAALLETVQILTPGDYGGVMLPEEHYIPIEPNGSNMKDVEMMMMDKEKIKKIAKTCKETFLSIKELRYGFHADEIISEIYAGIKRKGLSETDTQLMNRYVKKYDQFKTKELALLWPTRRFQMNIERITKSLGKDTLSNMFRW